MGVRAVLPLSALDRKVSKMCCLLELILLVVELNRLGKIRLLFRQEMCTFTHISEDIHTTLACSHHHSSRLTLTGVRKRENNRLCKSNRYRSIFCAIKSRCERKFWLNETIWTNGSIFNIMYIVQENVRIPYYEMSLKIELSLKIKL